jgi:hypothetical protein
MTRSTLRAACSPGRNFSVNAGGTAFTGGKFAIGSAINMAGPDVVSGADGQAKGLIFGHSEYLASIVFLPTQMGPTLAGLSSTLCRRDGLVLAPSGARSTSDRPDHTQHRAE